MPSKYISIAIFIAFFCTSFFSWVGVYNLRINELAIQSEDTLPALLLPLAILNERTLYLDSYYPELLARYPHPDDKSFTKGLTPFYLRKVANNDQVHYVSAFPIVTPLLILPLYVIPVLLGITSGWSGLIIMSHIGSSAIVALAGSLFYLVLSKFFLDTKKAILLTGLYFFATVNYALISQALWQHGTVQFFLILSLYNLFAYKTSQNNKSLILFGLFSSLGVLARPTYLIIVPFLFICFFTSSKPTLIEIVRRSLRIALGVVPALIFFVWYNAKYYVDISNQGYANQVSSGWLGRFPEGFLGIWLSPSKGILVYSPIFSFLFVSLYFLLKHKSKAADRTFYLITFGAVIAYTLVMSKWKHWYGGYSFGYRLASDVIPLMVILLIPYIKSEYYVRTKKLFYAVIAASVLIQIFGIIFFDGIWHAAYDRGFRDTGWLWSIRDSELAFNIRRILVKLGVLTQACPTCLPRNN